MLLLGVATLGSGCASTEGAERPGTLAAPVAEGAPFAGLAPCDGQPFVAVFRGFTVEGQAVEKPGSSPSSDIYGVRPDGSVAQVTSDLGDYEFGITDDAATVYASPSPTVVATDALAAPADHVVAIAPSSGRQTVVLEAPDVGAVAPAPDGSRLGLTVFVAGGPSGVGASVPAVVDLPAPATAHAVPPAAAGTTEAAVVATRELTWSPDGQRLAFVVTLPDATQEVRVADPTTGGGTTVHRVDATVALLSLDWSPDGTTLLTVEGRAPTAAGVSRDRAVEVDVASGRSTVVLRGVRGDLVYSAADGSQVTMLDNSPESSAVARTWSRALGGRFVATAAAQVGGDVGVVSADGLDVPRCAMP